MGYFDKLNRYMDKRIATRSKKMQEMSLERFISQSQNMGFASQKVNKNS